MQERTQPEPGKYGRRETAGMSLEALRDQYHSDLFDDYLPFWEEHGIDDELGGFMCTMDHDGSLLSTEKHVWHQGRGLWVYAFLYNNFGGEGHLEIARKARDFLVRHGRSEDGDWVQVVDREGNIVQPPDGFGHAGRFAAEGLQEYYRATGDEESMELAIANVKRSAAICDNPQLMVDHGYIPRSYPGLRVQRFEMVTIRVLTQILEQVSDPELEALAARSVDAVMNKYWNPEYRLNNEALDHNWGRPNDENEDFVYLGHSMEIAWMLLHEAMRLRDRALFDLVAERFERHMEVAWDDVYGGFFRAMRVHGTFAFDKTLWVQEEPLIGTMMLLEHTDWEWPEYWFGRTFRFVQERYPLKRYGFPLWSLGGDRKGTFQPHTRHKGNYHHPRHLMLNLLALERMIERGGEVSDFWG